MENKVWLDTETAGLCGPVVSVQYSINDGPIKIVFPFENPESVLELEKLLYDPETVIIGFNLIFDLYKLYETFHQLHGIDIRSREAEIMPFRCSCIDLMIRAKQHKVFNILSAGKKIVKLKKIPEKFQEKITEHVEKLLAKNIKLPIKLGKKLSKDKENKSVTVTYSIESSGKLKEIMRLLGEKTDQIEEVLELAQFPEKIFIPGGELAYEEEYKRLYRNNLKRLQEDERATEYAKNDIKFLKILYKELGNLEPNEQDSAVCVVAYTQYRGFEIDRELAQQEKERLEKLLQETRIKTPFNPGSSKQRLEYLKANLVDRELAKLLKKANKETMQALIDQGALNSEAQEVIEKLLSYGKLKQQLDFLKLFSASPTGRIHPPFRVWGTSTGRMAGTRGFNLHSLAKDGYVRKCVRVSQGGDFNGLEMAIAEAFFEDEEYTKEYRKGTDMHMMTACLLFPELPSYGECMKIKNDREHPKYKEVKGKRQAGKTLNFAILYFCSPIKVAEKLGCSVDEAAKKMEEGFFRKYKSFGEYRELVKEFFCTADTETWARNSVAKMAVFMGDLTGVNKRWCAFERNMARIFWEEADNIARNSGADNDKDNKNFMRSKIKGAQTEYQAIRSACLGAALGIQSATSRSVGNFPIQASGAWLTKKLMQRIWETFHVPMVNIHDEIIVASGFESLFSEIEKEVREFIREYKKLVFFLGMDWVQMKSWAEK